MGREVSTSIVLEADTSQVAHARRFARRIVDDADPAVIDDLQLIVSELFTNAIEHGSDDAVEITIERRAHDVSVTVDSRGPTPGVGAAADWKMADPRSTSGRGLGIVRRLADELVVERNDDEFVVTARISVLQCAGA